MLINFWNPLPVRDRSSKWPSSDRSGRQAQGRSPMRSPTRPVHEEQLSLRLGEESSEGDTTQWNQMEV